MNGCAHARVSAWCSLLTHPLGLPDRRSATLPSVLSSLHLSPGRNLKRPRSLSLR
jgi:hypothetical protein